MVLIVSFEGSDQKLTRDHVVHHFSDEFILLVFGKESNIVLPHPLLQFFDADLLQLTGTSSSQPETMMIKV